MTFVVMVTPTEDEEAVPVGPFPSADWADRYADRRRNLGYHSIKVVPLMSPILIDPTREDGIVFDPARNIDR